MLIDFSTMYDKYHMNIRGIIHIGAHVCEEMAFYSQRGIQKEQVIWIEANPDIVNYVNKIDPKLRIYNKTISNEDYKEVDFIVTNNFQSSSILELDRHKIYHPDIHETRRFKTKTVTFDTFVKYENIDMSKYNFLNMDIQGAELLALQGMKNTVSNFDYIYLEVNNEHLYKDCGLIDDIDKILCDHSRLETSFTDKHWGDALYVKKILLN